MTHAQVQFFKVFILSQHAATPVTRAKLGHKHFHLKKKIHANKKKVFKNNSSCECSNFILLTSEKYLATYIKTSADYKTRDLLENSIVKLQILQA